jgi:hypothetical protein
VSRGGAEPPLVKKAHEALRMMRLPVAPIILRSRAGYQSAMETGCSVEELGASPAADEVSQLWNFVERLTYGRPASTTEMCA